MQFVLMGFDQDAGTRQYAFQRMGDGGYADFTVEVELALIPAYGIRIQELPLLCRELLERTAEDGEGRAVTFTEADMRSYANTCAMAREAVARKKAAKAAAR